MLRSLYGSTHPQGDTEHCPEMLKLASSLQDGCLNAPYPLCCLPLYSSYVYVYINYSLMTEERTTDEERQVQTKQRHKRHKDNKI